MHHVAAALTANQQVFVLHRRGKPLVMSFELLDDIRVGSHCAVSTTEADRVRERLIELGSAMTFARTTVS